MRGERKTKGASVRRLVKRLSDADFRSRDPNRGEFNYSCRLTNLAFPSSEKEPNQSRNLQRTMDQYRGKSQEAAG